MTDKITLNDVATFDNSILNSINLNNDIIETAMDNTLSRDGTQPNQMGNALDMNGWNILNLPAPGSPASPARLQDVTTNPNINISLSLTGDATSPTSSGVLVTTVGKINGATLGTTTATNGNILVANGSQWNSVAPSGDLTVSNAGVTTIGNNIVTLAKTAQLPANTVIGNNTGSTATPIALTKTQLTAQINPFTTSLSGAVPSSPGGTSAFMRADGTWAAPAVASQYFTLINTLTGPTYTDTTSLTNAYAVYEIHFINIIPVTDQKFMLFQIHSGGAYKNTGYLADGGYCNSASGFFQSGAVTTGLPFSYAIDGGNALHNTAPGFSGRIRINNPSVSGLCMCEGMGAYLNANGVSTQAWYHGFWNTTAVVDGFQIVMDSGGFTSGTIKVYGVL